MEYYKYFSFIASLHRFSKRELIDQLLQEKARLHFLMMANVKSETGQLATTVSVVENETKTLARYYSIRRAIDELAQSIFGNKWIRRMIVHGLTHEFEDASADTFDIPPTKEVANAQDRSRSP